MNDGQKRTRNSRASGGRSSPDVQGRPIAPTVVDVAHQAGVSTATVSRVLNGSASPTEAMRHRVMSAVEALGFHLNPMAQGLRKGHSNTVALLIGDIEQTHFSTMTKHVQAALEEIGLDLLLFNVGHNESRLLGFLNRAATMRLKGVVIALSDSFSKALQTPIGMLKEHGIFVASLGQDLSSLSISSIVHEEREATRVAVTHMLEHGRKRIAYVGKIKGSAVGTERFKGYRDALLEHDLYDERFAWDVAYRYAAGRDAVINALDRRLDFDGIQAGSDELAIGALGALQDRGLVVPSDVAVIGFGGLEIGSFVRPALSSINSHPDTLASHLKYLFNEPHGAPAIVVSVPRSLILRQST